MPAKWDWPLASPLKLRANARSDRLEPDAQDASSAGRTDCETASDPKRSR